MLMPSIFGDTLLDDFFGFPTTENYRRTSNTNGLMQTDVAEYENEYQVTMNLPGIAKEDVKAELKDGYLTITASTNSSNEEKDKKGKYIRRERYSGTCSRSFYVGEEVEQEDIKAKFENGTLKLTIPKQEAKPQVEKSKYIAIEG
ncbi:MAG: Hsp20/alpha crystallin family protein [Coprococcus sp.]